MSLPDASDKLAPAAPDRFATTRWTLIAAAQDRASPDARAALAALCTAYWYPLYAFIRRQGYPAHEAQDLTQEFFSRLLEKDYLRVVDRDKGKFRSFLLAACKHFLANERDRLQAQKRGGGRDHFSLDVRAAESRYGLEPAHNLTPEKLFDRRWALTLLDQVLAGLKEETARTGKHGLFEALKVFLTGEKTATSYTQLAERLAMTPGAVKVAVHRLRRRYRELLREAIARTVENPGDIDGEIRDLFAALG